MKIGIIIVTLLGIKETAFTVWKGKNNLSILLDKEEKNQINFMVNNKIFS